MAGGATLGPAFAVVTHPLHEKTVFPFGASNQGKMCRSFHHRKTHHEKARRSRQAFQDPNGPGAFPERKAWGYANDLGGSLSDERWSRKFHRRFGSVLVLHKG